MQKEFEILESELSHLKQQGKSNFKFRVPYINQEELNFIVKLSYEMFFTTCIKRSGKLVTIICTFI